MLKHTDSGIKRLVVQFSESARIITLLQNLLAEADTLEQVYTDIFEKLTLTTATGINLDIIGEIVGQSRTLIDVEIFNYFGFYDNPIAQSFGTISDDRIGGKFVSTSEPLVGFRKLNDDEYRIFIRGRIARNMTRGTPEDIIAMIKFILGDRGARPITLIETKNASYGIGIGGEITLNQRALIIGNLSNKPAGVKLSYLAQFDTDFFGLSMGLGFNKGYFGKSL